MYCTVVPKLGIWTIQFTALFFRPLLCGKHMGRRQETFNPLRSLLFQLIKISHSIPPMWFLPTQLQKGLVLLVAFGGFQPLYHGSAEHLSFSSVELKAFTGPPSASGVVWSWGLDTSLMIFSPPFHTWTYPPRFTFVDLSYKPGKRGCSREKIHPKKKEKERNDHLRSISRK